MRRFLDDLHDFFNSPVMGDNFYCLQPLVLKKRCDNKYTILDGQQRLTTFYLVFKALNPKKPSFEIEYETRPNSIGFLNNIAESSKNSRDDNIDFFHLYDAYEYITNFFEDSKKRALFEKYFKTNAKVIWYEVDENEHENDVFLRLNIGKIPLTDSELIKALFLSKSSGEPHNAIVKRAETWYNAEREARKDNDKIYCFYNTPSDEDKVKSEYIDENGKTIEIVELSDDISRIEMYFRAISNIRNSDENELFEHFYSEIMYENRQKELWDAFYKCQNRLQAMACPGATDFQERILYHYLGFLLYTGKRTIYDVWQDDSLTNDFIDKCKDQIREMFKNVKDIDNLEYGQDTNTLKNLLLLFNLEELNIGKGEQDFRFNRFKMQNWTLEHIHPQSLHKGYCNDNDRVASFLKNSLLLFDNKELKREIEKYLKPKKKNPELLQKIYSQLNEIQEIHNISNLTLLDKFSNSELSDKDFKDKRTAVHAMSIKGRLIPHCTGKVFDKAYTQCSASVNNKDAWTAQDATDYSNKIKDTLKSFLTQEVEQTSHE